jgi:hypothetical protein
MSLTRKPKSLRKRVKALTDPQPEFVSLVTAGANMTPFRVVKSDDAAAPAEAVDAGVEIAPEAEVVAKADTHDIARIVFKAEAFETEEAVQVWLADGGYEGFEVKKTDEGFEVEGSFKGDAREVELEGVIVFVAERAPEEVAEAEKAESQPSDVVAVQPVAKKADEAPSEMRLRFDSMRANYSNEDTLKAVLKDGFDGVPPGMYELATAMYAAMRNAIMGNDMDKVRAIAAEFGELTVGLAGLFPTYDSEDEAAQRMALVAALAPEIQIAPAAKAEEQAAADEAPAIADETPAVREDGAEQPIEAAVVHEAAKEAGEAQIAGEAVEAAAEDTEKAAFAPSKGCKSPDECKQAGACKAEKGDCGYMAKKDDAPSDPRVDALTAAVTALVGKIDQLTTSVALVQSEIATKADDLAQRVSAIEGERQTRKGADVEEAAVSKPKAATDPMREHRTRAILGIRNTGF